MTIERKLLGTSPSGGATDVAEVFSTHVYTGGNFTHTINNGIDLAGEGGLIWTKSRSTTYSHHLTDTERGLGYWFKSDTNASQSYGGNAGITAFNSNGYDLGLYVDEVNSDVARDYVSWTFRKKKKFFDVVTYSGNGANRTIAHSLGGPVGFMAVKRLSSTGALTTFHTSLGGTKFMEMHSTYQQQSSINVWNNTAPTDAVFSLGVDSAVNGSGHTYVAYLFADNSAEDAEDQMIKCGSYSGTGGSGVTVNLGWEAQWVMVKKSSAASTWKLMDTMRGMTTPGSAGRGLIANGNSSESSDETVRVDSRGFTIYPGSTFDVAGDYVYMAIRAPMMIEPEAATDVFAVAAADSTIPQHNSSFPVDMAMKRNVSASDGMSIGARMVGTGRMLSTTTAAETANANNTWDFMDGWSKQATANAAVYSWMWKRAKGFFDVVAYTGDTNSGRTVAHSLGVAPEMIWVKCRTDTTSWMVYHAALTSYKYLTLDTSNAPVTHNGNWYNTDPTDSVFTVGDGATNVAQAQIAYLFATLDGISKVGSYTGNGSSQTIDCGFSAGARFVLLKNTSAAHGWHLFDATRGIVSGNDPYLLLNTNAAQYTNLDMIDPHNSGFTVLDHGEINGNGNTIIFYAIA